MEETVKSNNVLINSDASNRNTFGNLEIDFADYHEANSKTDTILERSYETSDSNMLLEVCGPFNEKCNIEDKPFGGFLNSSFLLDSNIEASDLCICTFQANNSNKIPKKAMISNKNLVLGKPCKFSDSITYICKDTSGKVSNMKSEISNTCCCSDDAVISNNEVSDGEPEASKSDTKQCASFECNSQTTTNNGPVLESYLNIPFSYLNISEETPGSSITKVFSEETLKRFRNIIHNQNFSSADCIECYSETGMTDSFMTIDEAMDFLKHALKFSNGPMTFLDYILSDSNPEQLEAVSTSGKTSESYKTDLNISNSESEICHSNLKFSDSNQESNNDKQSSDVLLKSLKNLINTFSEFQDTVCQVTANRFLGLGHSLDNDHGTTLCVDTKMENEFSMKFAYTEDENDHLNALICSEDRNTPIKNHVQGSCLIPSKSITFWSNYSDFEFSDSVTESSQSDSKFSVSDEESSYTDLKFSESYTELSSPDSKFSASVTESYYSNSMHPGSDKEPNHNKGSSKILHVSKGLLNRMNTTAEFSGIVEEKITTAEAFSNMEITSRNDRETFDDSQETEESDVPYIDDYSNLMVSETDQNSKSDMRLPEELLVTKEDRNLIKTNAEFQEIIENKGVSFKAFSKSESPIFSRADFRDFNPGTLKSSANCSQRSIFMSTSPMSIDEKMNYLSNLAENVSKAENQLPDVLQVPKKHRNQLKSLSEYRGLIENKGISCNALSKTKRSVDNEQVACGNSHKTMKNEKNIYFMNSDDNFGCVANSIYQKKLSQDYLLGSNFVPSTASKFSDSSSKIFKSDLKFSNRNQMSSTFIQSKLCQDEEVPQNQQKSEVEIRRNNADFSVSHSALEKGQGTTNDCNETSDNDQDTIVKIFKTVIKCHPIKKFEIPPYESANTDTKLGKIEVPLTKFASNTMHSYDIHEHRNTLECFSDIDSSSVMIFDFIDFFSQTSSIICDDLIKEFMTISAKVNGLLIKQRRNISTEAYDLRIDSLRCLDDELGDLNAKLITKMNYWVKQFHEIAQNVAQSRIGSRGLYHMGILRICMQIVLILIKFTLDMQLNLEDCETFLIFHHKRK